VRSSRRARVARASDGRIGVCLVTRRLPLGGAETMQLEVLAGIDRDRFRTETLCIVEPGPMAPVYEAAGVPVTTMGRRRLQHVTTVPRMAAWMRRRGIRVVLVAPHGPSLWLAPPAARLAGAGVAVGLHILGGKRLGIPSLPSHGVEAMSMVDALVLLSEAQRDYVRREEGVDSRPWRRVRSVVIPNGVRIPPPATPADRAAARRSLGLADEDLVVGCVAALRREKAIPLLMQAVAELAAGRDRVRLVLMGSGALEDELRATAERLGIAGRTVFAGFRPDAVALLPALDVKCLPSLQETFPVSVLEAMAASVPVVMSDPPGVPDLVLDGVTGFRVPVGDAGALADRIGLLLGDDALRARMGAAGRAHVASRYPLTRTLASYEQLFAWLAAPRRRRPPLPAGLRA